MTVLPRRYALDRAYDRVLDAMSLRRPQEDSLRKFHELTKSLKDDLADLSDRELERIVRERFPHWSIPAGFPEMTFALSTGVGKTRLMGALTAYLYLGGQSRCFLMLAPRQAILRKAIEETEPVHPKYLFADSGLLPAVRIWHGGNIEGFVPAEEDDDSLQLFILSPQALVGGDRMVRKASEFGGTSVVDYLTARRDLVALVDESHHLGRVSKDDTRAWTQALRDVKPRLAIGMTATPRQDEAINVLHRYSLREALLEKLYTKDARLIVRQRSEADGISDDDWDRLVLDFSLDRLARKEAAIASYTGPDPLPHIQPVMLVAAEDTEHADRIAAWLQRSRGLKASEILVTHSKKSKTEDEVERLVKIEQPRDDPVRVVVNVFELTEGWDVTNVYVIAPLRAMGTYQGAIQTMGRGLRLPAGHRLDDEELDSLDVLCFGRQSLEDVLEHAIEDYGAEAERESGVGVVAADDDALQDPPVTREIVVPASRAVTLEVPTVRRDPVEPPLDFKIGQGNRLGSSKAAELELSSLSVTGSSEGLKYDFDVAVQLAAARVVATLRYLSDPLHGAAVEELVEKLLLGLGFDREASVAVDWMSVAAIVADQIDRRYRREESKFRVTGATAEIAFGEFSWKVGDDFDVAPVLRSPKDWTREARRVPLAGWKRCVSSAAAFDSSSEFVAALIVDRASAVDWWARNDPPRLSISTPIGRYAPDFVVKLKDGALLLLEIKQSELFEAVDSDARVKARAAAAWCAAAAAAKGAGRWEYAIVLDDDVDRPGTLDELLALAVHP